MDYELKSKFLKQFIKEITYCNRNPQDTKALELLDDISTNPERVILPYEKLYRCRIINEGSEVGKETNFFGFNAKDSFVPPAKKAVDLRANYRYIPYLYASNNPYIALVEVRPRLGAQVSVATIEVKEKIRLLDFTNRETPSKMTQAKANLFSDLSWLFSKPVTVDDDTSDYIPTQFIAEYAKHLQYDGIIYRSSLVPEINNSNLDRFNVVVFSYSKCEVVKSNVIQIAANYIDCEQIDSDSEQLHIQSYISELIGGF